MAWEEDDSGEFDKADSQSCVVVLSLDVMEARNVSPSWSEEGEVKTGLAAKFPSERSRRYYSSAWDKTRHVDSIQLLQVFLSRLDHAWTVAGKERRPVALHSRSKSQEL
ncbi:hypothetical protein CLCR_05278 [Cladophialophora carrionii]|uniref:Uncharacterized protein n=1 Tax=Cladophialophora carrionii TaxID=86049 RepID=A0A1C1CLI2_9EURO|nr:hypothetical protein CLCR_05278 [Cladophialophora carrionii]